MSFAAGRLRDVLSSVIGSPLFGTIGIMNTAGFLLMDLDDEAGFLLMDLDEEAGFLVNELGRFIAA